MPYQMGLGSHPNATVQQCQLTTWSLVSGARWHWLGLAHGKWSEYQLRRKTDILVYNQQYHIIHYHEAHGHRLVMSPDLSRIITSVNINRSDNTGPAQTWLQTPPGQLCTAIDSVSYPPGPPHGPLCIHTQVWQFSFYLRYDHSSYPITPLSIQL